MSKKLYPFIIMTLLLNAAHGIQWPVLDNHHQNSIVRKNHKIIINSLLENAVEQKPGFKFKDHWFKVNGVVPQGNNYGLSRNAPLFHEAQELQEKLNNGHHLQILPVSPASIYKNFTERCMYKCLLDGQDQGFRFRIYSADGEIDQLRQLISHSQNANNDQVVSAAVPGGYENLPDVSSVLLKNWVNRPLGRGGPLPEGHYGYVSPQTSKQLMAEYGNHPILKHAFEFMRAADLADYQDPILFANYINHQAVPVSTAEIVQAIQKDLALMKEAQGIAHNVSRPFKDQLAYPQKGSARAIAYIKRYPELLQGKLPNDLKSLKGGSAQALMIAQYYIAAVKAKKSGDREGFQQALEKVGGLYRHELPNNNRLKNILSKCLLVQDGIFFTPAHNYVKHGDVIQDVRQNIAHLPNGVQATHTLQNIFTDCSGFACMVLRKLFPQNEWMQNNRAMSWQFAAAYDLLNGGTKFVQNGSTRALTPNEKNHLKNNRQKASKLAEMLTPVKNTKNVRAGDILVSRDPQGEHEGHVMIIADPHPNPHNPNEVIVVEMTQADFASNRNGLIWRKTTVKNTQRHVNRILRPVMN